jgi:hypothetical protein
MIFNFHGPNIRSAGLLKFIVITTTVLLYTALVPFRVGNIWREFLS